jgi:hypothetical protein
MKTIFEGYSREDTEAFAAGLQDQEIHAEIDVVEGRGGLDEYRLLVEDHEAERASILIESIETKRKVESNIFICPKCGSRNVSFVTIENENSLISETTQLVCEDCPHTPDGLTIHENEREKRDSGQKTASLLIERKHSSRDIVLNFRIPFMHFVDAQIGSISRIWIAILFAALGTLAYNYLPDDHHFTTAFLIVGWLVAFSWIVFFAIAAWTYHSTYRKNSYTKLVLSPHSVYLEDLRQTTRIGWEKIRCCSERAETLTLHLADNGKVVISKDALLKAREYSNFLDLMKAMSVPRSRPEE